jgi:hypothetical protein
MPAPPAHTAPERLPASWRALLGALLLSSALFALSVPLAPRLPVSTLLGALLAFSLVSLVITAVAVLTPTASVRQLLGLLVPPLVLAGLVLARPALPTPVEACAINVTLLGFGALLGGAVGGRVDHAGHLVLLAWVASVVDVLSVFAPEGPTAQMVQSPEVALPLVTLSWPIFGTASVEPLIGVGDVTIATLYAAAARATHLPRVRVVLGLLLGFALTFAALVVFERALPALPMLSFAVVLALAPHSLRVPPADRKKGFAFAALVTVLVVARLGAWVATP